jgi:hypothetical protein
MERKSRLGIELDILFALQFQGFEIQIVLQQERCCRVDVRDRFELPKRQRILKLAAFLEPQCLVIVAQSAVLTTQYTSVPHPYMLTRSNDPEKYSA